MSLHIELRIEGRESTFAPRTSTIVPVGIACCSTGHFAARACREVAPKPVALTTWTPNPKLNDDELAAYVCGLIIVSQPDAYHGPDEKDATPEQLATRERIRAVRDGEGDFCARVIEAYRGG